MTERPSTLPFAIDLRDSASMTEQVVSGLRRAIQSGAYRVGAKLPSLADMAKQLGVSLIVVRRAVAKLTEEGVLNPRQGYGVVVADPKMPCWNGTVLFVTGEHKAIYFTHFIIEELRRQLLSRGFLLTHVVITRDGKGRCQMDQLERTVLQSVRLAVVYNADSAVLDYLEENGVPCVAHASHVRNGGAPRIGSFGFDIESAFAALMRQPVLGKIRRALVVGLPNETLFESAVSVFRDAGIACLTHVVTPLRDLPRPESVQRAVMEDFLSKNGPLGKAKPDLLFLADDYVASGALTAMLARGVRVPEDVRVVSFANTGLGPVYVRPVSRLAVDPREVAVLFAMAVTEFVEKGVFPSVLRLPLRYVEGETL